MPSHVFEGATKATVNVEIKTNAVISLSQIGPSLRKLKDLQLKLLYVLKLISNVIVIQKDTIQV